jgi:hypothetical protein
MTVEEGTRYLHGILREQRFQPTETSRASLGDLNVAVQARALFMADPTLSERMLSVFSNRGAVTLSGGVVTQQERRTAEALVAGIPGVRSVVNDVIVTVRPSGFSHRS